MASFTNCGAQITNINRLDGNDLTADYAMRYRLASDPDVDASYTAVPWTKTYFGITIPFFDINEVLPGTYVVHTYYISDGNTTGTKVTVDVIDCAAP